MSIFAKLISKHALLQLQNKCTSKSTYCSLHWMHVPTNSTCLNWTKPQTMLISLLKLVSWSLLNSIKIKPLESLFLPAALGSLTSCMCKAAQVSSARLCCKEKKKNQELLCYNFPGEIETKETSPWFYLTSETSGLIDTVNVSAQSRAAWDEIFMAFISSLDLKWSMVKPLPEPPSPVCPCQQSLADLQ